MSSNGNTSITKPEAYDGNPDTVSVYTVHCELMFTINASQYNTDRKKKAYLLAFCTKSFAASWAEEILGQWMEPMSTNPPHTELTWAQAKKEFQDKFLPADLQAEAIMKLRTIRQQNDFEVFIVQFKQYQMRSGFNTAGAIRTEFLNALKPGLRAKLMNIPTQYVDTPDKLYAEARKFEMQYIIDSAGVRGNRQEQKSSGSWRKRGQGRREAKVRVMTAEEKERHLRDELCFNCHRKGHRANQCRQKKIHEIKTAIEDPKVPAEQVKKAFISID